MLDSSRNSGSFSLSDSKDCKEVFKPLAFQKKRDLSRKRKKVHLEVCSFHLYLCLCLLLLSLILFMTIILYYDCTKEWSLLSTLPSTFQDGKSAYKNATENIVRKSPQESKNLVSTMRKEETFCPHAIFIIVLFIISSGILFVFLLFILPDKF